MSGYYLIPRATVERIIDLLESLDNSCIPDFWRYLDLIHTLTLETYKIDIRVTHEKIVQARGVELRRYESVSLIHKVDQPVISGID